MELTIEQALQQGITAHQEGKLQDAERLYRAILQSQSAQPDANHNMGVLAVDVGKVQEALPFFKTALEANSNISQYWLSYIAALIKLGQIADAKNVFSQAKSKGASGENFDQLGTEISKLSTNPQDPPSDLQQPIINLYMQGRLQQALYESTQMLERFPNSVFLYNIAGASNEGLMQFDTAIDRYKQALKIKPDYAEAYYNMGNTLNAKGDLDAAIDSYKQAIKIKPDHAYALSNMGNVLNNKGDLDAAIDIYKQALEIKPDYAEAYYNMGNALRDKGDLEASIDSCKQALKIKPDYAEAYYNMGNDLRDKGDLEAAIDSYNKALKIKPDYAEAYSNMGSALHDKGDLEASIESYKRALKIKPDFTEAHYNLSFPHLLRGSLEKGFIFHEWRLRQKKQTVARARSNLIWDGEKSLIGKHFVIYEEQGLGDMIQFCRYLPLLEQKGANITFKVKPNLHALLQTMDSNSRLVMSFPEENEIDFETPLMSVPHLLNTSLETIPAANPYLFADQEKVQTWGERFSTNKFKVGICWQGSKLQADIGRSFPLSLFEGISRIPNVELISLHKGEGEDQIASIDFDLTTLGYDFDAGQDAFLDTVAVMMNCDLIITSDTAVAHLAGAAGRPTWVALQHIPDWRWMLDRADSPWYPTMTLYRQKSRGDWVDVFDTIERDLSSLLLQQKRKQNE
jgi:tetratricopeptide (TPR) repeat protein